MLCRLALILVCGLALAAPSLADDNPPPICIGGPCGGGGPLLPPKPRPPPPQADWTQLVATGVRKEPRWTTNRIFYARTPDKTQPWDRYIQPSDRQAFDHMNFSRYGVLAVFFPAKDNAFVVDAVFLVKDGLSVQISRPPPACSGGGPCVMIAGTRYALIKIRKGSLPSPVKLLYITEVP